LKEGQAQRALELFEKLERVEPGFRDTERFIAQARAQLAEQASARPALEPVAYSAPVISGSTVAASTKDESASPPVSVSEFQLVEQPVTVDEGLSFPRPAIPIPQPPAPAAAATSPPAQASPAGQPGSGWTVSALL